MERVIGSMLAENQIGSGSWEGPGARSLNFILGEMGSL